MARSSRMKAGGTTYRVAGICEVCVHPEARGRGLVKLMLATVHAALVAWCHDFALLFGDPAVYGSSGYEEVGNLFYDADGKRGRTRVPAMAHALTARAWPSTDVDLPGPKF
jgi:predicted N-acetyltransferase YhbS